MRKSGELAFFGSASVFIVCQKGDFSVNFSVGWSKVCPKIPAGPYPHATRTGADSVEHRARVCGVQSC